MSNMPLIVPTAGVTPGPTYAQNISADLLTIDAHDHTVGNGVQLGASSLNIQSALTLNNQPLINVLSVGLTSQTSTSTTLNALSTTNGDLYYTDGLGNQIRITAAGGIVGAPGSITGLSSPASVVYNAGIFTFQSDVAIAANLDAASIVLRNTSASSFGMTLNTPTLTADTSLTLPIRPATTKFMQLNSSGVMSTSDGVDNLTLSSAGGVMSVNATNLVLNNTLTVSGNKIGVGTITASNIADYTVPIIKLGTVGVGGSAFGPFNMVVPAAIGTYQTGLSLTVSPNADTAIRPIMVSVDFQYVSDSAAANPYYIELAKGGVSKRRLIIQPTSGMTENTSHNVSFTFLDNDSNPGLSNIVYQLQITRPFASVSSSNFNVLNSGRIYAIQY